MMDSIYGRQNAGVMPGLALAINGSYTFNNNSIFVAFANSGYKDYLYRYVYREAQWIDGYVYDFHGGKNGLVSTRLAPCLLSGFARQIVGTSLSFREADASNDRKAFDFISHKWYPKSGLIGSLHSAAVYMLGFGTTMLKLNKADDGTYWVEAIRLDQCYFRTDFRGDVTDATFLIRSYVDTKNGENNFFLVERRFLKECVEDVPITLNGKEYIMKAVVSHPFREIQVHRFFGMVSTGQMPSAANMKSGVNWEELPDWLRRAIRKDYSSLRVNEPERLPFTDGLPLGCAVIRNDFQDPSVPTLGFGMSEIKNVESELLAYDFAFSKYLQDIYQGSGKIGIPKALSINSLTAAMNGTASDAYQGLDFSRYEILEGQNPDTSKPIATQFALRALEWQSILDDILRKISTKLGMSPKTISSYLATGQSQKTATEVDSDDDASMALIEFKRAMMKPAVDRIIEEVLNQNGFGANVECVFGSPALMSKERLLARVKDMKESGFIDLRGALRMLFPEDDEEQIDLRIESIKSEESFDPTQQVQAPQPPLDTNATGFGSGLPKTDEDGE